MEAIHTPLILFIPGLLPKPEPALHKDALYRCLVEGVRRADPAVADAIRSTGHSFDLVAWTFDFYGEHRDIELDHDAIEAVIVQQKASRQDIREVSSWSRRVMIWLYRLGDVLPFLIRPLASEKMELHLHRRSRARNAESGIACRLGIEAADPVART